MIDMRRDTGAPDQTVASPDRLPWHMPQRRSCALSLAFALLTTAAQAENSWDGTYRPEDASIIGRLTILAHPDAVSYGVDLYLDTGDATGCGLYVNEARVASTVPGEDASVRRLLLDVTEEFGEWPPEENPRCEVAIEHFEARLTISLRGSFCRSLCPALAESSMAFVADSE